MTNPVIVLRHGRTEWNALGRFQGQHDVHLDEVGEAQVAAAAEVLTKRHPARLVSSDSMRALRTADALAHVTGLEVYADPRLREVDLGEWSGLTREQVAERFPEQYDAWIRGEDFPRGGGETFTTVGQRARAALEEHLDQLDDAAGPLVLVTHGGTALSLLVDLLDLGPQYRRRFGPLHNAQWLTVRRQDGQWRLVEHNVGATEPLPTLAEADVRKQVL